MITAVEQYLESLNDGRVVYCPGERVKDMRAHSAIRSLIGFSALDYALPNDPRFRPLLITKNEEGKGVNLLFCRAKTTEDLLRRRECFTAGAV